MKIDKSTDVIHRWFDPPRINIDLWSAKATNADGTEGDLFVTCYEDGVKACGTWPDGTDIGAMQRGIAKAIRDALPNTAQEGGAE